MRDRADDVRLMRRIALAMLGVGSLVCAFGVLSKPLTQSAAVSQGAVAAAFAIWFLAVLSTRPRRWLLEAAALASIAELGLIMATSNVVGTTPFFFLWPCVFLAFFSSRRVARSAIALVGVLAPISCAVNPFLNERADTAIGTVASVGIMGWLVMAMNERARTLSQALETAANTDPLTRLLNRRGFEPQLRALLEHARGASVPLTLIAIDIDHFKRFNDTHGHEGGDRALVRLADVLRDCLPPTGRAARTGGEEFLAVLPSAGEADGQRFGQGVQDRLRSLPVPDGEAITVSIGVAAMAPELTTADALVREADAALYAAKTGGRDRIVVRSAHHATAGNDRDEHPGLDPVAGSR